jgi:Zn-dependent protease
MLHEALSGILATLVAVILHELAHGLAALAMGDTTARDAGRLSLNPLQHIDKVGTILLPAFLAVSQLLTIGRVAFMFGWAKPVPINAQALSLNGRHDPRRLMAIVALAGPAMNFLLAFIGALALYSPYGTVFWSYFIVVNLVLGIFNLIPLPPLDGGRVAVGVLPLPAARFLAGSEKFGIFLVLGVVFVLPTVLSQLGVHFNPVNDALNSVLPWAADTVMHLAGHKNGL